MLKNLCVLGVVALMAVGCGITDDAPASPNSSSTPPTEQVKTDIVASEHTDVAYGEISDERCVDRKYVRLLTLATPVQVWGVTFPSGSKMAFDAPLGCTDSLGLNYRLKKVLIPEGQSISVPFNNSRTELTTLKLGGVIEKNSSTLYGDLLEDVIIDGKQFQKGDRVFITSYSH